MGGAGLAAGWLEGVAVPAAASELLEKGRSRQPACACVSEHVSSCAYARACVRRGV